MSKYTTTVKWICGSLAGVDECGFDNVDSVIQTACPKIFTSAVEFFDPAYKQIALRKILKHYYTREIGAETVGLWKLWMNRRLEEVMPYYNEVYKALATDFNPMWNTDLTTDYSGTDTGTGSEDTSRITTGKDTTSGTHDSERTENGKTTTSGEGKEEGGTTTNVTDHSTRTPNLTGYNLKSDTPQGGLSGLDNENYLTEATKTIQKGTEGTSGGSDTTANTTSGYNNSSETDINNTVTDNGSDSSTTDRSSSDTYTQSSTSDLTKNFLQKVTGRSGKSAVSMLAELRKEFFSVDQLLIGEFSDLFMNIY